MPLDPGRSGRAILAVGDADTARSWRTGDVDVLATPRLVALCEEACCAALAGNPGAGQTTVGVRVQFDHLAPLRVGSTVEAEATLEKVEGRRLTFTVSATDAVGLVGAGRMTRVLVEVDAFLSKSRSSGPGPVPGTETLRPVAWTYGTFGAFWGTWAVAAVDVERRLHLSHGRLGLLLSASVAAGGLVAAAYGSLSHRMGTARSLSGALSVWGACVLGVALCPGTAAFFVLFVAAMVFAGSVDAAMNTVVAIGARGDPATMVRFHALFNAGAMVGAGATGLLLSAGASWRLSWATVGATSFVLAAVSRRAALPGALPAALVAAGPVRGPARPAPGDAVGDPGRLGWRAVRALHLRTLAGVFLATALVEGGIDTWGVLYLRTHLASGALLGAGAYVFGQAIAVTVRWSSARHVGRIGARAGLVVGAGVAAAGLAFEAAASGARTAAIGLVVAIGGIALCWPLVMAVVSSSASSGGASSGGGNGVAPQGTQVGTGAMAAVVGAFTAVGYLGWVAGPAIVGWVADTAGLGTGLVLLAGVAAAAATLVLATMGPRRAR